MIWKIAWGGLLRHGRRSILIILAIAISVATMEFVVGMMSGMRTDFFETMVSSGGHLQVEHPDAEEALDPTSLDLLITDWQQYRDWFQAQPEVVRAEPVLTFGALVVNERTNAPMVGYGIDPATGFFSDVRGGLVEGRFLGPAPDATPAPSGT
ncbi:MAG: ABC transporter permease, partial [Spirochaeta sp.]|nr:ABC transporter permease [Spirochaeta sp.]